MIEEKVYRVTLGVSLGISGVGTIILREVHCILGGWVDGVILEWGKKKKASQIKRKILLM